MLCVPTPKLLVAHCAVLVLPGPLSAEAAQPLIELPPSVKFTVPVGLDPVTVAVNVTFAPTTDGLAELANVVLVAVLVLVTSVTLSMKVVLSVPSVPARVIVCKPVPETENGTLNALKLVLDGEIK